MDYAINNNSNNDHGNSDYILFEVARIPYLRVCVFFCYCRALLPLVSLPRLFFATDPFFSLWFYIRLSYARFL